MSMHLENTTLFPFYGEQKNPAQRLFIGYLNSTIVIEGKCGSVLDVLTGCSRPSQVSHSVGVGVVDKLDVDINIIRGVRWGHMRSVVNRE